MHSTGRRYWRLWIFSVFSHFFPVVGLWVFHILLCTGDFEFFGVFVAYSQVMESLSLSHLFFTFSPLLETLSFFRFFVTFSLVLETSSLSGRKSCTGISPCTGDFEFEQQNPCTGIFPCTGDFEFFKLPRAPKKKNAVLCHYNCCDSFKQSKCEYYNESFLIR